MRINSVVATDSQTKEKRVFQFDTASCGKLLDTSKGGRLNNYLEFCFLPDSSCTMDVEVDFNADSDRFVLKKTHEDNEVKSVLKKMVDGRYQVVARNKNCIPYIENILQEQLADILKLDYINNKSVEDFHGELTKFEEIRMLRDVEQSVASSTAVAEERRQKALDTVRNVDKNSIVTNKKHIDSINKELEQLAVEVEKVSTELATLKADFQESEILGSINDELAIAQTEYNKLLDKQDEMEKLRTQLKMTDDISALLPKIKQLQVIENQKAEYEKLRYALTTELEWQENELASTTVQLEEKQRQFAATQDKRNRIEAINNELSYIASLYEKNKQLNEKLLELNEQMQRYSAEKVLYANKLESIEKSVSDVKSSLDDFSIPSKSVGELLETVRVDVKIGEVKTQIEKLQSEIAVKESQIAEKESNLVIQVKRFKSVAELDVSISPIKAKDTIIQVLDAKYHKLETINISLVEKQRNLERASEDYKHRILQVENSMSCLKNELEKLMLRKQEEFKREVYLNSQKVYSDDASSVFAVSANFNDEEVAGLKAQIADREHERDELVERACKIDGALKEIKRHLEINSAEMETLTGEKNNINARYNEIVAQNKSEIVFNYLKALDSNNGTKYLLDVQQDAVRSESEVIGLKRSAESLKERLSSLRARLTYLEETQKQLGDPSISVDTLVSTNDKLKDELADIGSRLSANYEQYKAVTRQMESTESKIEDLHATIIEITKTIKVNEEQIAESTKKAQKYAGGDNLEQAIANFKYEIGDVESEKQMLAESKQNVEREVFKKRVELEKAQWLYESKCKEYDELHEELQFEFNLKGLTVEQVMTMDFSLDTTELHKTLAEYDASRTAVSTRIENYYTLLRGKSSTRTVTSVDVQNKSKELSALQQKRSQLWDERDKELQQLSNVNNARMKVAVATAEVETLSALKNTFSHTEIVGLLIKDKIKSMLVLANKFLCALKGNGYELVEKDYKVVVKHDDVEINYDELDEETKTAVYISLILSVPSTDVTEGRWLIFEERIAIDKKLLGNMLLSVDNVSYVVDYQQIK